MDLLGNPLVIALLNMVFESLIIPHVARALAKFRLGATIRDEMQTDIAIKLSILRVDTTFVLQLYMIVLAPMLCVFALDEVFRSLSLSGCAE